VRNIIIIYSIFSFYLNRVSTCGGIKRIEVPLKQFPISLELPIFDVKDGLYFHLLPSPSSTTIEGVVYVPISSLIVIPIIHSKSEKQKNKMMVDGKRNSKAMEFQISPQIHRFLPLPSASSNPPPSSSSSSKAQFKLLREYSMFQGGVEGTPGTALNEEKEINQFFFF